MGWAGIAIAEEFGGLGYGYTGLGLVLEQAGRNLSASPLQSTVLVAATLIAQLGSTEQKERLLPAIAAAKCWLAWRCRRVRTTRRCRRRPARSRDGDALCDQRQQADGAGCHLGGCLYRYRPNRRQALGMSRA